MTSLKFNQKIFLKVLSRLHVKFFNLRWTNPLYPVGGANLSYTPFPATPINVKTIIRLYKVFVLFITVSDNFDGTIFRHWQVVSFVSAWYGSVNKLLPIIVWRYFDYLTCRQDKFVVEASLTHPRLRLGVKEHRGYIKPYTPRDASTT